MAYDWLDDWMTKTFGEGITEGMTQEQMALQRQKGAAGFGSTAGMIGAAVSPKDSWQQRLSQVAVLLGQGKLTGLEREESLAKREDRWAQLIRAYGGGEDLTEEGVEGATKFMRDATGKVTITGNAGPMDAEKAEEVRRTGSFGAISPEASTTRRMTPLAREVAGEPSPLDMKDLVPF